MHAKKKTMIVFHICAIILYNDVGDKSPQPGCLRIVPCCALPQSPQYSHIVGYTSHFYAHIGAGPKAFHPLMSKIMWAQTF